MRIELSIPFLGKEIASTLALPTPPLSPPYIHAVCTDSRELREGDLFVDLIGDVFHQKEASGLAALLLCPYALDAPWKSKALYVPETVDALLTLASVYSRSFSCRKIAITGSVGKTTVKEYAHAVLSSAYKTQKTHGNFNNFIGVAYTLFSLRQDTEFLVLEAGMNHKGELRRLSEAIRPDDVIITNVKDAHVGNFKAPEELRDAKLEILESVSSDARVFIDKDSPLLQDLDLSQTCISVGTNASADYRAHAIRLKHDGSVYDLQMPSGELRALQIPSYGAHTAVSSAFAVAYGVEAGISEEAIRRGLMEFSPPPMRQELIRTDFGFFLILDCSNASPSATCTSLSLSVQMARNEGHEASALLGTIGELGSSAKEAHYTVGKEAARIGIRYLFAFGEYREDYAKGAIEAGMSKDRILLFEAPDAACAEAVRARMRDGEFLLIKASRAERAERILPFFLKNRES